MPIQVYVEVNGHAVESYHITRISSFGGEDTPADYLVVKGPAYPEHDGAYRGPHNIMWLEEGTKFKHTPAKGLESCIRAAMNSLETG